MVKYGYVWILLQYLATVVGAYEGGMSRPQTYMWVQMLGTGFLLVGGTVLIFRFGVTGAVVSMLLASAVRLFAFLFLAHAADKKDTRQPQVFDGQLMENL